MSEDVYVSSTFVDAPFDAVWAWISDPKKFLAGYPDWISEVKATPRPDGGAYEAVAPSGDRFEIVPRLDRTHGVADFEIVEGRGSMELSRARVFPLKAGGCSIVRLAYRWDGMDDASWGKFKTETDAHLERAKEVLERRATREGASPDDDEAAPPTAEASQADAGAGRNTAEEQRTEAPSWYPDDPLYDEVLTELYDSRVGGKDGEPHIPTFALRMLERLMEVGLLHTMDDEPPANVRRAKYVNASGKEQELWVRFDTRRSVAGYMDVEVLDTPRSDSAILAAMVAWLAQPADLVHPLEAFRYFISPEGKAQREKVEKFMKRMREGEDVTFEEWKAGGKMLFALQKKFESFKPFQYVPHLIRYYKPGAARYSFQEMQEVVRKTWGYMNDFLNSLRKLQAFLEYGAPNGKLLPAIEEPQRDVRAAILHDVHGLSYVEIGKRTGIPMHPGRLKEKKEHQTVRKMAERGKDVLEKAFGKDGWAERVEAMKAEIAWWRSLSREERRNEEEIEMSASALGIPLAEARRRAERTRP